MVALGYGLQGGGGVGDAFRLTLGRRWVLDVTFYLAITVGMLNLISGVIITTFGKLRGDKAIRYADTVGVCFICSIDKQIFDRASAEPEGFKTHVKVDHNLWNYMYFIFLLWEQDRDDDDGMEQFVRKAIEANEIIWLPVNKAIRLDAVSSDDSLSVDLQKSICQIESNISGKLEKFQTNLTTVIEQVNQVLKKDMVVESGTTAAPTERSKQFAIPEEKRDYANHDTLSESAASELNILPNESNGGGTLIMEVKFICGVRRDIVSKDHVYCTVDVDGVETKLKCRSISSKGHLRFEDSVVRLCEVGDVSNTMSCKVKIVIQSNKDSLETISVGSIQVEDLLLAENSVFEHFFQARGQDNQCKISIITYRA